MFALERSPKMPKWLIFLITFVLLEILFGQKIVNSLWGAYHLKKISYALLMAVAVLWILGLLLISFLVVYIITEHSKAKQKLWEPKEKELFPIINAPLVKHLELLSFISDNFWYSPVLVVMSSECNFLTLAQTAVLSSINVFIGGKK